MSFTRNLFFTGKGGVGKTTSACALSVRLADEGRRVLLISTDPASNLDEVLQVELDGRPAPVPSVPGLDALNIDPEQAAAAYRERVVGPYRGVLPDSAIASMEEQLSGACTVEIAAFDEFTKLLGDPDLFAEYDHLVFDTAPTGHTLRLMELPAAWSTFMDGNVGGTSCLGPLSGLEQQRKLYAASRDVLADSARTTLFLVARPDDASLREAERTRGELLELGLANQRLIVNGVFTAGDRSDPVALALEERGRAALAALPEGLGRLPRRETPLLAYGLVGVEALRFLNSGAEPPSPPSLADDLESFPGLDSLLEDLAATGTGVVMTMGKGGVGKTTLAARLAVALAERGHEVLLTTTDPASHVAQAVRRSLPGLSLARIDPVVEREAYFGHVMETAGAGLDAQGRALLEEDLRSPCTEEVAVFRAFARTVAEGKDRIVVVDTAPTGHTILLLDAAEAYHREVLRQPSQNPESIRELLPRLRDPGFTRILLVTLPEATPVHEAIRLEQDLERAGIPVYAWVVNQSLVPLRVRDPVLQARRSAEMPYIREVAGRAARWALEAWQPELPGFRQEPRRQYRPATLNLRHRGLWAH